MFSTHNHIVIYSFVLLALAAVLVLLPTAEGYASWFQCYVDLDESEIVMNQQIATVEQAPHTVELQASVDGGETFLTEGIRYAADQTTKFKIKVKPPPVLMKTNMQYVVEVASTFNDGSKGDNSDAAVFTFPKMCDGRRSFGRNYDETVTLEVNGKADSLEVWGGWATGFGQVSMTPRLVLLKGDADKEEL